MKKMKQLRVLIFLLCSAPYFAIAQIPANNSVDAIQSPEVLTYNLDKYNSVFKIKGTSSLHDWEMVSKSFDGKIVIERPDADNFTIKDIIISIKVLTFESDNRIMNKKTYEALKEEDHPFIKYNFNQKSNIPSHGNKKYPDLVLEKMPVSYNEYKKAFQIVQKNLN